MSSTFPQLIEVLVLSEENFFYLLEMVLLFYDKKFLSQVSECLETQYSEVLWHSEALCKLKVYTAFDLS